MRGKVTGNRLAIHIEWDHPRLCGEKNDMLGDVREVSGSPPPMRGKVRHMPLPFLQDRITPAYAGKRVRGDVHVYVKKDHPRLCGEKLRLLYHRGEFLGSPPPMRGKGHHAHGVEWEQGITPAYAGKSMGYNQRRLGYGDHPRLCGEKSQTTLHDFAEKGSPPPMRGKD